MMSPVVARVPRDPEAYHVLWRRTATRSRVQEQAQRIIGSGANILFGNADRSLWTDFASPIPALPVELPSQDGMFRYDRSGARGPVLATAVHLPRTPWALVVEFPMRDVLAPVNALLRQLVVIAALCVLLGVLAAWALSRRITEPLGQLAAAADAIARGDIGRRVRLDRVDELGQVGASFDSMAAEVAEARGRLEEMVAARTAQLERAQEALVRREKLAALGELSGGVSHELRTPLAVMSNAVRLLETLQPDAPQAVHRAHQMLRDQIALAQRIIRDMLEFSRITPAERLPIPLRDLADTQLARLNPPEGITVLREFPDSLPLVHVDPVHAGQVVLNLLTNAVQAMGDGGTLHLRGRLVDQGTVLLEVTDTGPGVPPEHLEKIFEPLFTTKNGGIGLGLAVSKSLALANGGDLAVANAPGRGATFAFAMPTAT
jgi:signal transduction histidine kinase